MLVLSRKCGEKVVIGEGVIVTVLSVEGGRVRIGIEAPDHIPILRGELVRRQKEEAADDPILLSNR
jgi:carbon storage regulator